MPLPHEQAAIERASGRQRQRLADAAALLDRVRAEHPGLEDPRQLPAHLRSDVLSALAAFRPRRGFGVPQAALLLVLAAGLAGIWFKPLRVFRCAQSAPGRAECLVTERVLGLLPVRQQTVRGIATAEAGSHVTSSESREDKGRTRTVTTRVEELAFKDPEGGVLWSASESHLIGASLETLAVDVAALASEPDAPALVRVNAVWPVLLLGTLFVTIAASALASELGVWLRDRGLIPQALYMLAFYWGALLVPVALFGFAWLLAFLGGGPPAALVGALGLG